MNLGSLPFGFRGVRFKTPPAYESDSCVGSLYYCQRLLRRLTWVFRLPSPPKKAGIPRNLSAIRQMPVPRSSSVGKAGTRGTSAHAVAVAPGSRSRRQPDVRRRRYDGKRSERTNKLKTIIPYTRRYTRLTLKYMIRTMCTHWYRCAREFVINVERAMCCAGNSFRLPPTPPPHRGRGQRFRVRKGESNRCF